MPRAAGWLAAAALLVPVALPAAPPHPAPELPAWIAGLLDGSRPAIDPAIADPDWHIPPATTAHSALAAGRPDAQRLLEALRRHVATAAAGGWPALPDSGILAAGTRDPAVAVLRQRLRASGDYTGGMLADPWYFEPALTAALRQAQLRHGLPATGRLDETTRTALNVPLAERIGQLAATVERWRWLPADPGTDYAWIDIGRGLLDVVAGSEHVLTMRVIVGHPLRATPSLHGEIDQVVFNPAWSVPRTIAVEDLLPRQQADPTFLSSRGIRVFRADGGGPALDPARIDWHALDARRFPYRLRQDPGPGNSLGRVRIGWRNPFDIYLHDTPVRGLFALDRRTLSSGCVRLEDATGFATWLLGRDRPWTAAATAASIDTGRTQVLGLRHRLPVWVVYLTTWVDAHGRTHFGRDLYGRDQRLRAALAGAAPGVAARQALRPPAPSTIVDSRWRPAAAAAAGSPQESRP